MQQGDDNPARGAVMAPASTLVLEPRLDLVAARALSRGLAAMGGRPLDIDASRVEVLGGLCLQVLLAAGQHWARAGLPLRLVSASDAFAAALDQFGLGATAIENGAIG